MAQTTRLLFRWGVWMSYTEWRPDQPQECWDGSLSAEGGSLHSPNLVIYHGCWAPQHRTYIALGKPQWRSPLVEFTRPVFGYKGLEGLLVDVEGDAKTVLRFRSGMIDVDLRLGDVPRGGKLAWHVGPKYSCSELAVCRIEDEGVYWNEQLLSEAADRDGCRRQLIGLERFAGDFLPREIHHRVGAWIPSSGSVQIPFRWEGSRAEARRLIVTWYFAGTSWAALSEAGAGEIFSGLNSPTVQFKTDFDGRELSTCTFKAKYMRGACSTLEHTDELDGIDAGSSHELSITNLSKDKVYLVLYPVVVREAPRNWPSAKRHLPFLADWFDGSMPTGDRSADRPSGGRGLIVGYDTNMMAAENGWIDSVIRFLATTRGGNYILFRTESDAVSEQDWRRWFVTCRESDVYFGINTAITNPALPIPKLLTLARELGGEHFIGMKQHELSIPLYAGRQVTNFPPTKTLDQVEHEYLDYVRTQYAECPEGVNRLLGEAMLAHRYAYKAGVDLILSETMTGNTSLLLAEARGASRAYGRELWGMHVACHVHATPEGWPTERMFWLNLCLGYLSGASIIEDEEGGLAKVHSFVSGPSEPLPAARQKTIAEFFRWASARPRRTPLQVEIGFLYGRHEAITGGMSLNTERPVRVWEEFGPSTPEWEYGRPERGWLLLDLFMPGVWLCPVLQDAQRLRRWFAGTPYGQVDVVPIEAEVNCLSSYRLLVCPGWNTMSEEDLRRLIQFVERGGTLVIGLPQLQSSPDRTRVLSSSDWQFADAELLQRLCGLRVKGRGKAVDRVDAFEQTWTLAHDQDGKVHFAELELSGGRAALSGAGVPLVVENALGKGRVFTFTAWEYFGHRGLLPLARRWLERFVESFPLATRLEGGDGEVSFFVYPEQGKRRVFLINTDWTVAGNVKRCRVKVAGASADVKVREGQVSEVLL